MGASVKIMLSYDYCHFEVSKSIDGMITDKEINEMRKDVQRLADEAVRQYKVAKDKAAKRERNKYDYERFERLYKNAIEKNDEDRAPEEKAIIKQHEDEEFMRQFEHDEYDYQDDDERVF